MKADLLINFIWGKWFWNKTDWKIFENLKDNIHYPRNWNYHNFGDTVVAFLSFYWWIFFTTVSMTVNGSRIIDNSAVCSTVLHATKKKWKTNRIRIPSQRVNCSHVVTSSFMLPQFLFHHLTHLLAHGNIAPRQNSPSKGPPAAPVKAIAA